ncbi:MAG: sigma-70 family RNA polymerase sigma factor [bacterium]|nr:sigma-70 family RNA polymerase sigma factor [bacterium]
METSTRPAAADPRESPRRYLPLDRRSAARFVDEWEPLVLGVLRRLRVEDLGDAASRVFHKALRGLPEFRGDSKLSTWVYRIAWREGLRVAQQEKRRRDREAPLEVAIDRPDGAEDQLRTLERQETAAGVRASLERLSPRDREILALRYLEELPFKVIADRLDISFTAAKVRSHRALTRLRVVLAGEENEA